MGMICQLHEARQAKAKGIFAAVNIAARRMGFSEAMAENAAVRARDAYSAGGQSAARVVSLTKARLRGQTEGALA